MRTLTDEEFDVVVKLFRLSNPEERISVVNAYWDPANYCVILVYKELGEFCKFRVSGEVLSRNVKPKDPIVEALEAVAIAQHEYNKRKSMYDES